MLSEKQIIQQCKSIVRGQVDGDKAVAMLILQKLGIAVSESVKKSVRASETVAMDVLSKAVDVYLSLEGFIAKDRYAKAVEVVNSVHRLVSTINGLNGTNQCLVTITVSSWNFRSEDREFKYIRGKYTKKAEREFYQNVASICKESEVLMRVYAVLEMENL